MFFTEKKLARLFKRHSTSKSMPIAAATKRARGGHEKTPLGFCLRCFHAGKSKFWLTRGNHSSVLKHLDSTHKHEKFSVNDVVSENLPAAQQAVKAYKRILAKG